MHGMAGTIKANAVAGLNLGGMDLTQGSVMDQMQGYSSSLTSFTGDVRSLEKQHLNKQLLQQIIQAGPVQGDMLAQSILGGNVGDINKLYAQILQQAGVLGTVGAAAYPGGGVKNVNQLWQQLGIATKGLGAQAAMSMFGGFIAPNLKSGTFTANHVTININAKGAGGQIDLTPAQIKQLVQEIQAALLKQARRNQKTGLQAAGKNP
jgi:hypothetical protein